MKLRTTNIEISAEMGLRRPPTRRLRLCFWPTFAFVMICAGNKLVEGQQEAARSLDKVGKHQEIFHQPVPSQQLAGPSQRTDLGNPGADLIGNNDNTNKSRHANSTPHQTQPPLLLRVVPISSRGALSFVMSSGAVATAPSTPGPDCPALPASSSAIRKPMSAAGPSQQPTSVSSEVLAVEGTNLKLNLAIVGLSSAPRHSRPAPSAPIRLRLHWQRDGQPIGDLNQARGRIASIQLVGESEPETIRHLLGLSNSSSSSEFQRDAQPPWMSANPTPSEYLTSAFVLLPFINERPIEELERSLVVNSRHSSALPSLRQRMGAKAHDQQHELRQMRVDKFLADGQSIDWPKLGAHLSSALNHQHCQLESQPSSQVEQLLIIQLELNQLHLHDKGQYQLLVCQQQVGLRDPAGAPQQGSHEPADCLQSQLVASVNLQVVEDVPRLESWFEPQLLQPGERLSIKCEATGFTLPQISWYLDGQLLSEQSAQHSTGAADGERSYGLGSVIIGAQMSAANVQFHSSPSEHEVDARQQLQQDGQPAFKIGDYVSQDNHVHSFVNSSYGVRPADGGFYKCQANNGLHVVEHEARIDVRGPVAVGRLLPFNVSTLAGSGRIELQCPWSGYPPGPIEWYFRPQLVAGGGRAGHPDLFSDYQLDSPYQRGDGSSLRRKRRGPAELPTGGEEYEGGWPEGEALADEQQQLDLPDPERDEWLAQASAMTGPPNPDEYPEPLPDYPVPVVLDDGSNSLEPLPDDYEKFPSIASPRRTRRATLETGAANRWTKLPQSRRHQVHPNGTLTLRDIQPEDQGLYKCHVTRAAGHQADQAGTTSDWSNELHLAVLAAPVISPFSSSKSLREGMRNFLTCSVISGDSPVRLAWLKDGRPIEEHIGRFGSALGDASRGGQKQAISENGRRIKVDSSNEFTSTLSFSHVDFRDDGNYTCLASNKAASVNYTARMVVNVPPKWIRSPKDVESVAGQSIVIDCQAEAHPSPRIWWEVGVSSSTAPSQQHEQHANDFRPPESPLNAAAHGQTQQLAAASGGLEQAPNHYRTIISNSRIHILENASLVIRELTKQDQGFYLCQAANNFGLLSALIKLTVNVGASFANKFQMKFVRLNERVEFDCDPTGQTPLTVTWFVRQRRQQAASNQQQPSGMLRFAAGPSPIGNQLNQSYASPNLVGEHLGLPIVSNNQSSSAAVIYSRRHRQQLHNKPNEAANDDDDADRRRLFMGTIQTEAPAASRQRESNPEAGGKVIEIDSSISFETLKLRQPTDGNKPQHAGELVRLHIKQARRANSGDYICHASNEFGDDEKLIKLLVQEPPDSVTDLSLLQVDSRQISITWPAPFNGNSPITSYTLEWTPLASGSPASGERDAPSEQGRRWSQLTVAQPQQHEQLQQQKQQVVASLSQLQPLTSYEIRVRAHNQFGHSAVAPSLVVTTGEEAPVAPPGDIRAIALSSSKIQVSWLPPQPVAVPSDGDKSSPAAHQRTSGLSLIKGYYMGYKAADSNDSYIFKTIAVPPASDGLAPVATNSAQPRPEFGRPNEPGAGSSAGWLVRAVISDLRRSTTYSIILQAYNSAGPGPQSDPLQVRTLDNDPPPAPVLRVAQATSVSLELQWSFRPGSLILAAESGNFNSVASQQSVAASDKAKQSAPTPALIDGYHLYFRPAGGVQTGEGDLSAIGGSDQWHERHLSQEAHAIVPTQLVADAANQKSQYQALDLTIVELQRAGPTASPGNWSRFHASNATLAQRNFRYQLDGLACGNFYQIYLVAYNSFGSGQPSQLVRAKTRGLAPIAPRNQADFVIANSTQVHLNLAAWQSGGCPLTNFEIKYKQLRNRQDAINMLQGVASSSSSKHDSGSSHSSDWLLLSNNISPEQRSIELRDVQPETWYGLWVTSESAAGKTSAHFAFMTLDKLGRLPSEAVEPLPVLSPDQNSDQNSMTSINNLSALFRSGSGSNPIRSILVSLSGPGGSSSGLAGSPLILSACLCLVLFATCLLLLIRRYTALAKDAQAFDSAVARSMGAGQASKSFPDTTTLDGDQYGAQSQHTHYAMASSNGQANEETRSITPLDTNYSLRVSPCKTGATVITNSSSSTNGSSSGALLLPAGSQCDSAMPHLAHGSVSSHNHEQAQSYHEDKLNAQAQQQQQHVPMDQFGQFVACSAATLNPHRNSRLFSKECKFSTLNQSHQQTQPVILDKPLASLPATCFRTLQHHHNLRPVSTFLPHGSVQQSINCQLDQDQNLNQDYGSYQQQQQIYSKLRFLQHFEEASAHDNCNAMCQIQQPQQQQHQQHQQVNGEAATTAALNQLFGPVNSSSVGEHQVQASQNSCIGSNSTCQQQSASTSSNGPNEQDNYALPFPPKWV